MSFTDAADPEDIELTCPVCLDYYEDPVFVCVNHHTLCRGCYQKVSKASGVNQGCCPECREKLCRPTDNSYMRRLIRAQERLIKASQVVSCQHIIENIKSRCTEPSDKKCLHCDKYFCAAHYSTHKFEFQTQCAQLLTAAENFIQQIEKQQRVRLEWEKFVQSCVEVLHERYHRRMEQRMPEPNIGSELSRCVADLQHSLAGNDLQAARLAYDELNRVNGEAGEQGMRRGIVSEPTEQSMSSLFHDRLLAVMEEAEHAYLDGVFGLVKRICTVELPSAKLKLEKCFLKIPELKCRLRFVLPGQSPRHTSYVELAGCGRLHSGTDLPISFDFQHTFDYSTSSMPSGPSVLAAFLRSNPLEIAVCLQLKWKEGIPSVASSKTTYRSKIHQLVALVPLSGAILRGECIDEDFPLLDENEAVRGSIRLSTNFPLLLHQVFQELPDEEKRRVGLSLQGDD